MKVVAPGPETPPHADACARACVCIPLSNLKTLKIFSLPPFLT